MSCVCDCVVGDNLNVDARRSGAAVERHLSVVTAKEIIEHSLLDRTDRGG